jgi:uncharacterized protein
MRYARLALTALVLAVLAATPGCMAHVAPDSHPLIEAAKAGDAAECERLLDQGVDHSVQDRNGRTPLMWAAWDGHRDAVDVLIRRGADVHARDDDGYTAFLIAVCSPDLSTVRSLLLAGSDLEAVAGEGRWTPLLFAVWNRRKDNVELLINAGANTAYRDRKGTTALALARFANYPEITELLAASGGTE